MIPVTRTPQPQILKRNAAKWLEKLKEEDNVYQTLKADPETTKADIQNAKKRFNNIQNKYCHPEIKDQLVTMFHGKCAYCESKITVVTYGAIEHFFPKCLYPDRTFEWSNFLLSCDRCNDVNHKGTRFPVDSQGNPLLINPTDGSTDPNAHLEFVWDNISGLASIYGRDERGEIVVDIFDLCRYRDWETDRKSTRLNSSHSAKPRMPSSA